MMPVGAENALGPSISPARTTRGPISVPASNRAIRSASPARSLPMSRTVVIPEASWSWPSPPNRWTCMSQSPGISVRPCASITCAPAGTAVAASPTAVMRSPTMTTVASGTTRPRTLSNSRACVIARPAVGG